MGGCRCSYKDCPNTTKSTENVHFFHYPVKHKERCAIWITNAEKPEFCNLEEDQLRNKVICEQHFENKWFPNPQKKRLLQGAVPTLDGAAIENERKYEYGRMNVNSPLMNTRFNDDNSVLNDDEIEVLPTNEDRTIFLLNTDSMSNKSSKIESYIYKNGMIVPSIESPATPKKPPNSLIVVESPAYTEFHEKFETVLIKHENETVLIKNENDSVLSDHEIKFCEEDDEDSKPSTRNNFEKKKGIANKIITKNYERTIKQHSREIANIKKMLETKQNESKDANSALNVLKNRLPPTLFTVVSLTLNCQYEINDDDVEFFTKLHNASPEAYKLLIEKYNWDLPAIDIVDTTMEEDT